MRGKNKAPSGKDRNPAQGAVEACWKHFIQERTKGRHLTPAGRRERQATFYAGMTAMLRLVGEPILRGWIPETKLNAWLGNLAGDIIRVTKDLAEETNAASLKDA
jgi:hypothetical protein